MKRLLRYAPGAALGVSLLMGSAARAQPIVNNGGFEPSPGGSIPGWYATGKAHLVSSPAHAYSGNGFASVGSGAVVQSLADLKSGQSYKLSGYLSPGFNAVSFRASVYGGDPHLVVVDPGLPISTYQHFSGNFVAQSSHAFLVFEGRAPSDATRLLRLDNVSITAVVPELDATQGAAAIALTLGGLALMTERKRSKL